MKKQILTLTMCLALTATSALAEGTKTVAQKAVPQAKSAVTSTKTVAPATTATTPQTQVDTSKAAAKEEAKKRFEEKKAQERQLMYTALGLSPEQKVKAEALDVKVRYGAGPLIRKLQVEARKLGSLRAKKASTISIWKQEIILNKAKKDVEKYFKESKKSFNAILTPTQRKQFKTIDDERKAEMKKFRAEHPGHKYGKPSLDKVAPEPKPATVAPRPDDKK